MGYCFRGSPPRLLRRSEEIDRRFDGPFTVLERFSIDPAGEGPDDVVVEPKSVAARITDGLFDQDQAEPWLALLVLVLVVVIILVVVVFVPVLILVVILAVLCFGCGLGRAATLISLPERVAVSWMSACFSDARSGSMTSR